MNPEERARPLIERGRANGAGGRPMESEDSEPDSLPGSQTSEREPQMEPDPNREPEIIEVSNTEEPNNPMDPTYVAKDVTDYAITHMGFEELLCWVGAFGSIFDPMAIEDEGLPINLPMGPRVSSNSKNDTCNRIQHQGTSNGREDNIGDVIMTEMEPVGVQDKYDAPAAIVIGLEKGHNDFLMEVALMNVGPRPTIAKVVDCLQHIDDPRMRILYHYLQQIPCEDMILSTSKRPVEMRDLTVVRGGWGIRPEFIGSFEEAQTRSLEQCIICPETDIVWGSLTLPVPSSILVMILYIERQTPSPAHSFAVNQSTPFIEQALPSQSLQLGPNKVSQYLNVVIKKEYVLASEHYALYRSQMEKVFATMLFTRIIENICHDLGVHFTGKNLAHRTPTMNGPDISLEDIIKFIGDKTPMTLQGSVTAATTFKNHHTWYLRTQSCVSVPESHRANLNKEEWAFLELLEKLLGTEYSQLGSLVPSWYGHLKNFNDRVTALNNKLNPKVVAES